MPALLTHYICGDCVLKGLNSEASKVIKRYRNLYNLGTQGPDVFFYHNGWPWAKGESLSKVGTRLHNEKVRDFFHHALEIIEKCEGQSKEMLLSYIYGYVCHYSLDIHCHPYVFYKTGFPLDKGEDKRKYGAYHRRLEAEIDVLMAEKVLKKKAKEILSYKFIEIDKNEAYEMGKMYKSIFLNLFNIEVSVDDIMKSAEDMVAITKAMRDTLGIKKTVFGFMEEKIFKYKLITNMIYPRKIEKGLDPLNLKKSTWYYPWDNTVPMYFSFTDLFNDAVDEAKTMCQSIYEYLYKDKDKEELLNTLGNRSFESGMNLDYNIKFKYYDLIYR